MNNYIYFFRFDADNGKCNPFSLIHYICVKSFLVNNPALSVKFVCNVEPNTVYYYILKNEFNGRLITVHVDLSELHVEKYNCIQHAVDRFKLSYLIEHPGMVFDTDFICLKEVTGLLNVDRLSISEELDPLSHKFLQLSIGLLVSNGCSKADVFLKEWLDKYNGYTKDSGWTDLSGKAPTEIWKLNKSLVNVLSAKMYDPYDYTRDRLRDLFLHKKPIADYQKLVHVSESISWDRYLKPLDVEHIKSVDTTFTLMTRQFVANLSNDL
jgi:hypothetical protein